MAEWIEFSINPWAAAPATVAVRALGTNALPDLVRILEQKESRYDVLLELAWGKLPLAFLEEIPRPILEEIPRPNRWHLHRQAMAVLCVAELGPRGANTVPVLMQLLESGGLNQQIQHALRVMGPAAAAAAPGFATRASQHPDWLVSERIWAVLWSIGPAATNAFGALRLESDPRCELVGNAGNLWFTGRTNAALELLLDAAFRVESGTRSKGRSDAEATGDLAASMLAEGIGHGVEPLVPDLLGHLQQFTNPLWRERAATVLSGLQKTLAAADAAAAIGAALRRELDVGALRAELKALAQLAIPDPGLIPVLEKLLQGSDEETISLARVALIAVGSSTNAPSPAMQ